VIKDIELWMAHRILHVAIGARGKIVEAQDVISGIEQPLA
jgi:hypothetical protein